jgi:vacuolar protein sorting-associated protein 13A/C
LVGKLVLKIPWKKLYSAPVEVSVEGLFLLVVPNQEVKYDRNKEEKWSNEAKKTELQRVEDKKKQEREKGEMGIIFLLIIRGGGGGAGAGVVAAEA